MELSLAPVRSVAAMFAELASALETVLGPGLVGETARRRLMALAPALPPARLLIFERYLGAGTGRIDLSLGGAAAWPVGLPGPALAHHPGALLFEYDLDGDLPPPPAVFAAFTHRAPATAEALADLAAELAGALSSDAEAMLARAAAAQAPAGVRITHFGVMRGRAHRPMRLNVMAPTPAALGRYAVEIGCGAAALAGLDRMFALADGFDVRWILSLDLAEAPLPRVGLECYLAADPPPWARLLGALAERGVCAAGEVEAVCAWPGRAADIDRWINHLKLVAEPGGPPTAKAYLAARRREDGA